MMGALVIRNGCERQDDAFERGEPVTIVRSGGLSGALCVGQPIELRQGDRA